MKITHDLNIAPHEVAWSGASYLATLVNDLGRFKYRFDPEQDVELDGYNVLRHCGTIWAMTDVNQELKSQTVRDACNRAVLYLLNNFLAFDRSLNNACMLEKNAIKLGGNALAILALLSLNSETRDDLLSTVALRLGQFMLDQQLENGDFIHKRYFKSGKISEFRSDYYTGEALLALVTLYQKTGEQRFLDAVLKCENLLAQQDYGVAEQSHWMLYALEALGKIQNEKRFYNHAEKIALNIINSPDYRDWGRSTPTACRTEGLLAFLRLPCPDGQKPNNKLRENCLAAVKTNLRLQLMFQRPAGSFIRGGDDRRHTEVRIDYIQHNISSFHHFGQLVHSDNQP